MARNTDLSNGENGRTRTGTGRFRPGNAGGPGRPKGSPNRGTVDCRQIKSELLASWREHGAKALETIARERPVEYVKLVVSLLPADYETGPSRLECPVLPDPPGGRHDIPGLLDERCTNVPLSSASMSRFPRSAEPRDR